MRVLNLNRGEGRPVASCTLLSFLTGLPHIFTLTTANLLFLEEFSATMLPATYAVAALVVIPAGAVARRLEQRHGPVRAAVVSLAALAWLLALARLAWGVAWLRAPATFVLTILSEVEFSLCSVAFWSIASRMFDVRQASRTFALITVGELLAAVLGGIGIPLIAGRIVLADLLWLAAAAHVGLALYVQTLGVAFRDRLLANSPGERAPARRRRGDESARARFKLGPYLQSVAGLMFCSIVVIYAVDNAFYLQLEHRFAGQVDRAAFVGRLLAGIGVLTAVFKVVIAVRWRAWFGGRVTLLSAPACLAALAAAPLGASLLGLSPASVFWSVVTLKVGERLVMEGIHGPAYFVLFQPLPPDARTRAQSTLETSVAQVATLVVGLGLLVLEQVGGARAAVIVACVLAVALAWILVARRAWGRYLREVARALEEHRLPDALLIEADVGARAALRAGLRSSRAAEVSYCLSRLDRLDDPELPALLVPVVERGPPDAVEAACGIAMRRRLDGVARVLLERVATDHAAAPAIRSIWLRAAAAIIPAEARPLLERQLVSPEASLRVVAAAGLVADADAGMAGRASAVFDALVASTDASERLLAVGAIAGLAESGDLPGPAALSWLQPLLADPDARVRAATVAAAAPVADARFRRDARALLLDPTCTRAVSAMLAAAARAGADPGALDELIDVLGAAEPCEPIQVAVCSILGAVGGERAVAALWKSAGAGSRAVRHAALGTLSGLGARPHGQTRERSTRILLEELDFYQEMTEARAQLRADEAGRVLRSAIDAERNRCLQNVVHVTAARVGDRRIADVAQLWGSPLDERAFAFELFEAALDSDERMRVMPVLERYGDERRARGRGDEQPEGGGPSTADAGGVLEALVGRQSSRAWASPWIVRCARALARERTRAQRSELDSVDELVDRVRLLMGVDLMSAFHSDVLCRLAERCAVHRIERGADVELGTSESCSLFVVAAGTVSVGDGPGAGPLERGATVDRLWPVGTEAARVEAARTDPGADAPPAGPLRARGQGVVLELKRADLDELLAGDLESAWRLLEHLCARTAAAADARELGRSGPSLRSSGGVAPEGGGASIIERALALKTFAVLGGLDDEALLAVAGAVEERWFEADDVLCARGDVGTTAYLVVDGTIEVHGAQGRLTTVEGPAVVGEISAILVAPRSATLVARRFSRVFLFERALLRDVLRGRFTLLRAMCELVASRSMASMPGLAANAHRPSHAPPAQ